MRMLDEMIREKPLSIEERFKDLRPSSGEKACERPLDMHMHMARILRRCGLPHRRLWVQQRVCK